MGGSLLVEASKMVANVHWNSYRSVYLHGMSQRNESAAQLAATNVSAAVWQGRRLVTILEEYFVPQTRTGSPLDSPLSVFQMHCSQAWCKWFALFSTQLQTATNVGTECLESCCKVVSSMFFTNTRVPCFSTNPNTRSNRD